MRAVADLSLDEPGFRTRRMSPADTAALLALYRRCEDFLSLGPEAQASNEMVWKDLETSAPEGGIYAGIYTRPEGALVGVLDVIATGWQGDARAAFIELLMLACEARGHGLGAAVLAALEKRLVALDVTRIQAGVQTNNPGAVRFWLRHGFQPLGPAQMEADGTLCYRLEKPLGEGRD